jgi:hypothetical protein
VVKIIRFSPAVMPVLCGVRYEGTKRLIHSTKVVRQEQIRREEVMRSLTLTAAAAAALLSAESVANRASAMMFASPAGIRAVIESLNVTANVQYVYGGRGYCWYDYGWNGPGWYWCGYAYSPSYSPKIAD